MEEKIQSVQYRDSEPSEFAHKPPKQEMDLSCFPGRLSPGIKGGAILSPIKPIGSVPFLRPWRPLDMPFGVVARFLFPLPLHLSPYSQKY